MLTENQMVLARKFQACLDKYKISVRCLAERAYCQADWVDAVLSLLKLDTDIQKEVEAGRICFFNAVMLAKLPIKHQLDLRNRAATLNVVAFMNIVHDRLKEIRRGHS